MQTHYTLTYDENQTTPTIDCMPGCRLEMTLYAHGKVQTKPGAQPVDLLTIYYSEALAGNNPAFTLLLDNTGGWRATPIKCLTCSVPPTTTIQIAVRDDPASSTTQLTITGPTREEDTVFELCDDHATPPQKLKIRVVRQPAPFTCPTREATNLEK